MAGGGGVDHHQVVVALPDLPADLADGQDLPDAGGGGGHEVEDPGQGAQPGDGGQPQLQVEVLPQRRLGVHGHHPQVRRHPVGLERRARRLIEVGQVALGIDLAGQGLLAMGGAQQGQRRRCGALAHSPFAGDEEQPAIEEIRISQLTGWWWSPTG